MSLELNKQPVRPDQTATLHVLHVTVMLHVFRDFNSLVTYSRVEHFIYQDVPHRPKQLMNLPTRETL